MISICDVIVSQKTYNGELKQHFFGQDNNFTCSLGTKIKFLGKYEENTVSVVRPLLYLQATMAGSTTTTTTCLEQVLFNRKQQIANWNCF